jgi:hypothetical protein
VEKKIEVEQLSTGTRDRLARFTRAIKQYEIEGRKVYFRNGGYLEIPPSVQTITEWSESRADLKNCPEQAIRDLLNRIQIERIDDAMADETKTEVDVIAAAHNAKLAENELVALGQRILDSENSTKNFGERKWSRKSRARRRKSQFRRVM